MNWMLAEILDLSSWLEHAPQTAGPTAVAAIIVLALLALVLPRAQRGLLVQPFVLLAVAIVVLLVEEVVVESLAGSLSAMSLVLLFASIGRSGFLLVVVLLERVAGVSFQKIFLDVGMALVYLAIGYPALRIAGVEPEKILTGSAIISVVVGLALQNTLGNIFAGLSIQIHQPFQVGDWIQFNDKREHIGKVRESNWRATTVVTLDEVEVVIPNNKLAELPLTNFNRPDRFSRRSIYFVCPYDVPPRLVQRIVLEAIAGSFGVLDSPAPSVVTNAFMERGVEYWLRFFTLEFDRRDGVDGGVRDRIWYALGRHGITMPVARHDVRLQQQTAELEQAVADRELAHRQSVLGRNSLFQDLSEAALERLARGSRTVRYMQGETILRQGDPGHELFIVDTGTVSVSVRGAGHQDAPVGSLGSGQFFGEMSLLTGAARSATIRAAADCQFIVIDKPALATVFEQTPEFIDQISDIVATRQAELDSRLAQLADPSTPVREPLLLLVKRYFGIE